MTRGKSLSLDVKNIIVNFFKNGEKPIAIAKKLSLNKSIVSRVLKRFRETGDVREKKKSGRPKKTNSYVDKQILKIARKEPSIGSNRIKAKISETLGVEVCSRTIRARLIEGKLYSRSPAKKTLLSGKNRQAKKQEESNMEQPIQN